MSAGELRDLHEDLLESLSVGIAVFDTTSRDLIYGNESFDEWFPVESRMGIKIEHIFPDVDQAAMIQRFANGEQYMKDTKLKIKRREVVLSLKFSRFEQFGNSAYFVEMTNTTKVRALEQLIDSYNNLTTKHMQAVMRDKEEAEKKSRELEAKLAMLESLQMSEAACS